MTPTPSRGPAALSRLSIAAVAVSAFAFASTAAAAPLNLAPFGVATARSQGFGAVAADGNDGNRNGAFGAGSVFHTLDPDTAAFYQVDLGDSFYIDRVQIFPRTDARQGSVENFRLSVLADDGAGNPGPVVFDRNYVPVGAAPAGATNAQQAVNGSKTPNGRAAAARSRLGFILTLSLK